MRLFCLILNVLCLLFATASAQAARQEKSIVTVLASTPLTTVLTKLARHYSAEKDVIISVVFESPGEIAEAINQGDPSDLVIMEDDIIMRDLKRQGVIDVQTLSVLVDDGLVFAAKKHSLLDRVLNRDQPFASMLTGINEKILFILPDPQMTSLGRYAKESLQHTGHWEDIEPFVIITPSAANAAYLIRRGSGAGFLYRSQLHRQDDLVSLIQIPPELHTRPIYQAAVVAGDNMAPARDFLRFLHSEKARSLFREEGFTSFRSRLQ